MNQRFSHLHVLLDGNGGGAGAVLDLRDGDNDSCFVRHDDYSISAFCNSSNCEGDGGG